MKKKITGGKTSKPILWGQHHHDAELSLGHHKKRKSQANICDEYRCKNLQQNIS